MASDASSNGIKQYWLNCISVPNFASLAQNFPKVKVPMHVHVQYASHHEMARTIELGTLIELHKCTKIGVGSSKFPRTEGPLPNKV